MFMNKDDQIYTLIECNSADEYIELLRKSNSQWSLNDDQFHPWIFRGHNNHNYSLKPSVFRDNFNINEYAKTNEIIHKSFQEVENKLKETPLNLINPVNGNEINFEFSPSMGKRLSKVLKQIIIERYFIEKFTSESIRVRLPITNYYPFGKPTIQEQDLTASLPLDRTVEQIINYGGFLVKHINNYLGFLFSEVGSFNTSFLTKNEIDWNLICAAQHVGIKTRLLDWTNKPWVAAFFSCWKVNENEKTKGGHNPSNKICVWAFNPSTLLNPFNADLYDGTIIELFNKFLPSEHNFLYTQQAVLTLMHDDNFYYIKHGEWPDLISYFEERVSQNNNFKHEMKKNLIKITLQKSEAKKLIQLLDKEDITIGTLMPTFNHVADMIIKD